jgi:hypothetical protein
VTGHLPLCDGGRCAQILAAIAKAQTVEKIAARSMEMAFTVTRAALARLGHTIDDPAVLAAVRASVEDLAGSMAGVGADPALARIALDLAAYRQMGAEQRAAAVRELAESALRRANAVAGLDDDDQ